MSTVNTANQFHIARSFPKTQIKAKLKINHMHVQICTCAPCELWRSQCVFCSASLHDSCTRHIVEKQTCQTHYKNADHWHKGGLHIKIWIAAFSRLESKKNLTYRYAYFQPCRCIYVYAHTGIEKAEKNARDIPPSAHLSGCTVTPNSSECGVLPSLLSACLPSPDSLLNL